jgi:stalled ribosome alternative rescue factor ArfA
MPSSTPQINHYLDEIGIDFEDDLQAQREKAEREKEKGNGAYKRGMFQRAAKHFSNAMELVSNRILDGVHLIDSTDSILSDQDPCEVVYPLNRSLPLIKLKK